MIGFSKNIAIGQTHSDVDAEEDAVHAEHPEYVWEEEELALMLDTGDCLTPVCFVDEQCHVGCEGSWKVVDSVEDSLVVDGHELLGLFGVLNVGSHRDRLIAVFIGAHAFICSQRADILRLWDEECCQEKNQATEAGK